MRWTCLSLAPNEVEVEPRSGARAWRVALRSACKFSRNSAAVLLGCPASPRNGAAPGLLRDEPVCNRHTGLLGVLLLVSPRLWYPANAGVSELWGVTPLEDQQLAGLIMWVPAAGLIYAGAALLLAGIWIRTSGKSGDMIYVSVFPKLLMRVALTTRGYGALSDNPFPASRTREEGTGTHRQSSAARISTAH
ncbi:cytochrome c oxidase assembly protein [Pseudaminobacter sp. NGMCC 1.201702]|uniref:cytochrome c oxidase assembly protein n=1 Tax=Pseudaminobacter sp. NGMCC 1.201702 TaxID=3391825 RepID=UPI0039EE3400